MNKRSMRILGFSQIRDMLVRLAPSRLSKEAARALNPDTDEDTVVKSLTDTEEAVVCLEREGQIPLGGITDIRPFLEKAKREVPMNALPFGKMHRGTGKFKIFLSLRERSIRNCHNGPKHWEIFPCSYSVSGLFLMRITRYAITLL